MKTLREEAGITQETLAWDCGFAKAYLSQVEAGKCVPSLAALVALALRLRVDALEIMAMDSRKPLHRLVDAVRRRDGAAVRHEIARLRVDIETSGDAASKAPTPPPVLSPGATLGPPRNERAAAEPRGRRKRG